LETAFLCGFWADLNNFGFILRKKNSHDDSVKIKQIMQSVSGRTFYLFAVE